MMEKAEKIKYLYDEIKDYEFYRSIIGKHNPRIQIGADKITSVTFSSAHTYKFIPVIEEIISELKTELEELLNS